MRRRPRRARPPTVRGSRHRTFLLRLHYLHPARRRNHLAGCACLAARTQLSLGLPVQPAVIRSNAKSASRRATKVRCRKASFRSAARSSDRQPSNGRTRRPAGHTYPRAPWLLRFFRPYRWLRVRASRPTRSGSAARTPTASTAGTSEHFRSHQTADRSPA